MFYSTRYFFRLAGLLLAACLVNTRFPVLLRGVKHVWKYIEYFFSHYAPEKAVSEVYEIIFGLLKGIK
jgi:hypothetical protein